ncbi:hypothetical protein VTP01DRAFT_9399 [Rhizomucor pusillus]|uniref:uncharacterized protein n=1 Tax=Rhizomucor pusillus TaxID=4840 RepID=UPI0037428949
MRLFLQYHANGSNIRHLKAENEAIDLGDDDLNQCTAQKQTEVEHIELLFDVINRGMLADQVDESSQGSNILQTNVDGQANDEPSITSNSVQDLDVDVLERMEDRSNALTVSDQ